jgi:hypothetical protein
LAEALRAVCTVLEETAAGLETGDLRALSATFERAHRAVEALERSPAFARSSTATTKR